MTIEVPPAREAGARAAPGPNGEQGLICGDGTSEAVWLEWLAYAPPRRRELRAWVPQQARLVVVAPHPDDEILACGGLLRMHVALGGTASVVAVTDGEASHAGSREWPPTRLAETRRIESALGLSQLGVAQAATLRLHLPDGQVQRHVERLAALLKPLLQAGDVLVTTWRHDGHPDHEASALAAARACAATSSHLIEAPVWMWHWARPDDPRVPWHALQGLPLTPEVLRLKRKALAAHATQLADREGGLGPVLIPSIVQRAARSVEYYFL